MLGTYYALKYNARYILYIAIYFLAYIIPEIPTKLIKKNTPIPQSAQNFNKNVIQ
jgi:hypothetical protein